MDNGINYLLIFTEICSSICLFIIGLYIVMYLIKHIATYLIKSWKVRDKKEKVNKGVIDTMYILLGIIQVITICWAFISKITSFWIFTPLILGVIYCLVTKILGYILLLHAGKNMNNNNNSIDINQLKNLLK